MENTVAVELQRRGKECFYHSNGHECDFLVREGNNITQAIQVSVSIDDETTRKREVAGVLSAMKAHHLPEGVILTIDTRTSLDPEEGCHIEVIPCWQWMLGEVS